MTGSAGVTTVELEHLVFMATCAPSVHNTQPWEFSPITDGLLLRRDRRRQLTVLDPEGRELLVSCGTAVHHLQVAARALSLDCELVLFPDTGGPDDVAEVRLTRGSPATVSQVAAAVAILHRHTTRGRFSEDKVPEVLLHQLRVVVEQQHGMFRVIHEDELTEVEVLVSRAEQSLRDTPGYADELARWVWSAPTPERGDGLPAETTDHGPGRAESLQGRAFAAESSPAHDPPPRAEHPTVVLLSTLADSPLDWVQAGQSLSALLLAATNQGVVAQPIGQVVDLPSSRWALQTHLGTVGAPQMLLRLGFGLGTDVPVSPRRPVAEVLHQ